MVDDEVDDEDVDTGVDAEAVGEAAHDGPPKIPIDQSENLEVVRKAASD